MKCNRHELSRRFFVSAGSLTLAAACTTQTKKTAETVASATGTGGNPGSSGSAGAGGQGGQGGQGGMNPATGGSTATGGPLTCTPSDDNIQGPYYRPEAPFRDDLTEPGMVGVRVTVQGRVLDPSCVPITGALVDIWQANDAGRYDNDEVDDPPPGTFILRGRLYSGSDGSYSFKTIIPGHYLNGSQYRPAHIHVTVTAAGHKSLTTQLYFEGDPYNSIDPFIEDSLIMPLTNQGREKAASFDFVLPPTGG